MIAFKNNGSFPPILGKILIIGSRATESSLKSGFYYMPIDGGDNYIWDFIDPFLKSNLKETQKQYIDNFQKLSDEEKLFIRTKIDEKLFLADLDESELKKSESLHNLFLIQKQIIQSLDKRIGMCDLIDSCLSSGSEDSNTLINSEKFDDDMLVRTIKQSSFVIINGGFDKKHKTGPLNYFYNFLTRHKNIKHIYNVKKKETCFAEGEMVFEERIKIPYIALPSSSGNRQKYTYKEKKGYWKEALEKIVF